MVCPHCGKAVALNRRGRLVQHSRLQMRPFSDQRVRVTCPASGMNWRRVK